MWMGQVFLIVFISLMACRTSQGGSASSSSSSSSSSSAAAGSVSAEVIGANGCPKTWTPVGEQCLLAVMSPEFWEDTLKTCVAEGGARFFPESEESMNYVRGLITTTCEGFWLGCINGNPANGQFECPDQDGVYWNNETDNFGFWNWSSKPSSKSSDAQCTLTYGVSSYWIEGSCKYGGVCPVCARSREPMTTIAPSSTVASDPGITIPLAPQGRHRSTVFKAFASDLGCLANRYVFVIFAAPTRIRCAALCFAHRECASFNFYKGEKQNCQLNSDRIGSVPADGVTYNTACTYYE